MYDEDWDGDDCRKCGRRDYGFDLPDTRSTLYIRNCKCKPTCVCTDETRAEFNLEPNECVCSEEADGCCCENDTKIQIRINRIWDQECPLCGGNDWRPEWQVLENDKVVATVPTEGAAEAVVESVYPNAEAPPRDEAWESERWLRRAEGWE